MGGAMSIVLLGATSGSCTLQEQAVAGSTTLTLPTFNGTVGLLVSGTAVSASSTSVDFTGIPAGVRRITVMFYRISTNGTSSIQVQLGDSGGIETTGYEVVSTYINNSADNLSYTSGFVFRQVSGLAATGTQSGQIVFNLIDASANRWTGSGSLSWTINPIMLNAGSKELSATLDRVRITTVNGTDTFDAGSINILYE
jgi:hypothetical protein